MTHWPYLALFLPHPLPITILGLGVPEDWTKSNGKQAELGIKEWPVGIILLVGGGALEGTKLLLVNIDSTWA